ncbi:MAG: nucleotidyltransferase substrate binding protein [Ignavibacteriae bacterium]|nr:nucleotidyltransferase substrate binding protein [Ignavibacteriota bacterium]
MNQKQIRWQQRYKNFSNSFDALHRAIKIKEPNETEKGGIIQFYEVTFELSWKTLKDYLESEGFDIKSPRETIKQAFQLGIILKGEDWLDALDDRNLTAHIYDIETANKVIQRIKKNHFQLLKELNSFFQTKI